MRYIYLFVILGCFSCNNQRVLQLQEIKNAEITTILDVSPAYIFYDESQPDSTLLNRKNLISTTNWLVNVDKRLTLRQAIPHIKFLQDKKRNAEMHKNENAKNYFTCNDTSIGNLGFVEFTNLNFAFDKSAPLHSKKPFCHIIIKDLSEIYLTTSTDSVYKGKQDNLVSIINNLFLENGDEIELLLEFNDKLTFQDYIALKATIIPFEKSISKKEFIIHR
jgi:hypothetical protein